MPFLTKHHNPAFPAGIQQSPPYQPPKNSEPGTTDIWDHGFKRLVPLLQSPPLGAGILAITLFFFITFLSNVLLAQVTLETLGITVTIGTFGIVAIVLLILFLF